MSEIYTDPPQSRNEAIIKATIDGTEYTAPPQSRMEDLLLELKEAIEHGGGGGGTSDYTQLTNKPQVNGVTLTGNKTSADLGLMPEYEVDTTPTEDSENLITSGGVWSADKNINDKLQGSKTVTGNPITITDAEAMNAESVKVELEPKQDLHGYDKPWVGGSGKNKLTYPFTQTFPMTFNGVTITDDNGQLTINNKCTYGFNLILVGNSATVWGSVDNAKSLFVSDGNYTISGGDETAQIYINHYRNGALFETYTVGAQSITISVLSTDLFEVSVRINSYTTYNNLTLSPQIEPGQTATDFEPYSNICPISGYSEVNVENNTDTYTIDLDGTKYGGELDVVEGSYSDEWGYATLDGSETWTLDGHGNRFNAANYISNIRDTYESLNNLKSSGFPTRTPDDTWNGAYGISVDNNGTISISVWNTSNVSEFTTWLSNNPIQIAYRKKTPSSVSTTPTDIPLLENTNNISTDGTNITLKYQPNNVIGECKAYTDEKCAKVLPQPPTTDGTYHLECSVSSGIPTITWVSNS